MKKFSNLVIALLIMIFIMIHFFDIYFLRNNIFFVILILGLLSLYISKYDKINKNFIKFNIKNKKGFIKSLIIFVFCILYSWVLSKFNSEVYGIFLIDAAVYSPIIVALIFVWSFYFDGGESDLKRSKFDFFLISSLKVIYIPFLYGACFITFSQIFNLDISNFSFNNFVDVLFKFGIAFDVCIGLYGYVFISKIFENEIISPNRSLKAWFFCLICYPPLNMIFSNYLRQQDDYIWSNLAQENIFLYIFCGVVITLSWVVYWLSTYQFGLKFSNLTWRGLINSGPYKYLKHPAYFSKNIYWWVYTVPFMTLGMENFILNVISLSVVSFIYFMRARTEEQHLMNYSDYQEYSIWIEKNGLWAKIKKIKNKL